MVSVAKCSGGQVSTGTPKSIQKVSRIFLLVSRLVCKLEPTVFASNQLNNPACSFFKQTLSIQLKTTCYMIFLRNLEVPDLIF